MGRFHNLEKVNPSSSSVPWHLEGTWAKGERKAFHKRKLQGKSRGKQLLGASGSQGYLEADTNSQEKLRNPGVGT